ncbi:hypothetical protein [Trichococcus shcherbakoviae]|uniref:Uncharacterized protein n=1 Tax=Trichococcus shcherbakoviae TaxID=2094020 RepID=A0A383TGA5_9LACT|nr:hypothetical protein [Trichococcus shcherbakoviae]SYZ78704.1 Hypothetical protein TART1_1489 [Trichococcus shcherbakoviae]
METETVTLKEAVKLSNLLTIEDLKKIKDEDVLASEVAKHIYILTLQAEKVAGIDRFFAEKLDENYARIADDISLSVKKKTARYVDILIYSYNYLLTQQEANKQKKKTKVNPNKENPVIDVIQGKPINDEEKEAIMVGRLNSKVKRRLDNWVLKGLNSGPSEGSIKQRLGLNLAEKRPFALPRIRLDQSDVGTAYDVRVKKHGINKFFDLIIEEYVEGTLKTADVDLEYGWLALTNDKSVYPVKFNLKDAESGKVYEAVSLTKESFDFVVKDEYQRYGLYIINGLGLFAANLTKEDHLVLMYLKGKAGITKDYMYGHNAIKGRSIQMVNIIYAAHFEKVIPEGDL